MKTDLEEMERKGRSESEKYLCLYCVITPRICDLLRLDLKIKISTRAETPEREEDAKRTPPEDNVVSIDNLICQERSQEESDEDKMLQEDQEQSEVQKEAAPEDHIVSKTNVPCHEACKEGSQEASQEESPEIQEEEMLREVHMEERGQESQGAFQEKPSVSNYNTTNPPCQEEVQEARQEEVQVDVQEALE